MGLKVRMTKKEVEELYLNTLFNNWFRQMLRDYGITGEDLKYLPAALKKIKELKEYKPEVYQPNQLTEEEKKFIKNINAGKVRVGDYVAMFAGDVEELKIGGKDTRENT